MKSMRAMLLAAMLVPGGCGGDDDGGGGEDDGGDDDGGGEPDASPDADASGDLIEERPYGLVVPKAYDPRTPTPLVLLLHGYTASGAVQLAYFGLSAVAEEQTLLLAYPDGTVDGNNNPFWNATDACCDFFGSGVDDVAYLTAVMDDVAANYNVDPKRVFVVGHSNGGFMSHRMACDRADRVAAIASLAGATWSDPAMCQPSEPVAVLQVHGDDDQVILYGGGGFQGGVYPAAVDTVGTWAEKNGCSGELEATDTRLDLDADVKADETRVERFAGCPSVSTEVELWTLEGAGHVPDLVQPTWPAEMVEFLLAHAKE